MRRQKLENKNGGCEKKKQKKTKKTKKTKKKNGVHRITVTKEFESKRRQCSNAVNLVIIIVIIIIIII